MSVKGIHPIIIALALAVSAGQYAHSAPTTRICHLKISGSGYLSPVSATMHCTEPDVAQADKKANRDNGKLSVAITSPGMVQALQPSRFNYTGVQLHNAGDATRQGPCQLQWDASAELCMLYICWPPAAGRASGEHAVDVVIYANIVGVDVGAAMQSAISPGSGNVPKGGLPACVLCLGGNITASIVNSTFTKQTGVNSVCLGGHARATIVDSMFTEHEAGAPIFADGASELVLARSVVGRNDGYAVRVRNDARANVSNTVFYKNKGDSILNFGGRAVGRVFRTWFYDNHPGAYAFTIQAYGQAVVNVSQCAIIDNQAPWTGGVHVTQTGVGYIGGGTHFCSNVGPAVGADVASQLYIGDTQSMGKVISSHIRDNPCSHLLRAAGAGSHMCPGALDNITSQLGNVAQSLRSWDRCSLYRRSIQAFVAASMTAEKSSRDHLEGLMLQLGHLGGVSPVVFSGNPAGAVIVYVNSSVEFTGDCLFVDNSGNEGGAVSAQSSAQVKIYSGSTIAFVNNTATRSGGALHCMGHSMCRLEGQMFHMHNRASTGGAVAASGASNIHMPGACWFSNNSAASGGAVHARDNSSVQMFGDVSFLGNTASEGSGGSILVDSTARMLLLGQALCMLNNTASVDGAAMHVMDSGAVVVDAQESLCGCNKAGNLGACVSVNGKANLLVGKGSMHMFGNNAGQGGAIALDGVSRASIGGSVEVVGNQAGGAGGGFCLSGSASLIMEPGSLLQMRDNIASQGGAIAALDDSGLMLLNNVSVIARANVARISGGSVYVQQSQAMSGSAAGSGDNSSSLDPGSASVLAQGSAGNSAPLNKELALPPRTLRPLTPTHITAYVSRRRLEDGLLPLAVVVEGVGNWPVQGVVLSATYAGGKNMIGGTTLSGPTGVANFSSLKLQDRPGTYTVTVRAGGQPQLQPVNVSVQIRQCVKGEVFPDNSMTYCDTCTPGSYSFNPANSSCDVCPEEASCPGGNILVPLPGFWHSAPDSPQLHRCLHAAACGGSRLELAGWQRQFYAVGHAASSTSSLSTYSQLQCSPGHTGHLCAVCMPGYGLERTFACSSCMPPATWAALFVLAALLSCGVIRLLAHLTWAENSKAAAALSFSTPVQAIPSNQSLGGHPSQSRLLSGSSCSNQSLGGHPSQSRLLSGSSCSNQSLGGHPSQSRLLSGSSCSNQSLGGHPSQSRLLSGSSCSSQLGHQPAHVTPGDVLKTLVVFIQYCFIIGSMRVEWPAALSASFTALSWLWSSSNGQALSIDCMPVLVHSTSSSQRALARVLFHLLSPAALLLLLMVVECAVWQAKRHLSRLFQEWQPPAGRLNDHLIIIAMVGLFFFYPALVQVVFSMFVCVSVDDPGFVPYGSTGAVAGSYWAFDMQQGCWVGYHRRWMIGVGALAGLPVLVGVPAAIAGLLQANSMSLTSPLFSARYNFLYRCYREQCTVWGSIELVETAALVAVAVFGHSIGLHYQALLMNCVLAVMLLLLLVFRPYAAPRLQRLRVAGLVCLLVASYVVLTIIMPTAVPSSTFGTAKVATVIGSLSFDTAVVTQGAQVWKEIAGALTVILGVLYLVLCVRELARSIDWAGLRQRVTDWCSAVSLGSRLSHCCSLRQRASDHGADSTAAACNASPPATAAGAITAGRAEGSADLETRLTGQTASLNAQGDQEQHRPHSRNLRAASFTGLKTSIELTVPRRSVSSKQV